MKEEDVTNLDELSEYGMGLLNSPDMETVEKGRKIFEGILNQYSRNHSGVLFAVAVGYMRDGRHGLAEPLLMQAISQKPDFAEAINNLGFICNLEGRLDEARIHFEKALELEPDRVEFINNMCTFYVNAGQPDTCIEWANKAFARATETGESTNDAQWNRALAYLEKGMWEEGWEDYKAGLHDKITSSQKRKMRHYGEEGKVPIWDGTPGQTVVVYGEQGVGDEILGVSMLEEMSQKCNVIYEAHPRLVEIMRHSFEQKFPIYGTRKVKWEKLSFPQWHDIDAQIPILGLGEHFRQTDKDFPRKPYLKPFPEKVARYRSWLDSISDRPKIGVSWKGGSTMTRFDLRSIPLPDWADFMKGVDADFISLQYDAPDRPGWNTPIVEQFEKEYEIELHHRPEVINDLDECYGGLIHALDLVICVNTSLVHACGAYGVPCWTLTPSRPAWRYNVPNATSFMNSQMAWYGDHVVQYRQEGDDWESAFKRLHIDLRGRKAA